MVSSFHNFFNFTYLNTPGFLLELKKIIQKDFLLCLAPHGEAAARSARGCRLRTVHPPAPTSRSKSSTASSPPSGAFVKYLLSCWSSSCTINKPLTKVKGFQTYKLSPCLGSQPSPSPSLKPSRLLMAPGGKAAWDYIPAELLVAYPGP